MIRLKNSCNSLSIRSLVRYLAISLLTMMTIQANAADDLSDRITLSGYIKDGSTGEELLGATIFVKELKTGTSTNSYGFYSLSLPKGNYTIDFSYIGFQTTSKTIKLDAPQSITIELQTESKQLQEVVVSSVRKDANVTRPIMSAQKMEMKTIQKIPALMGEVDLIKAIQLLPGVISAGEGTSSFSVRGGGIDQNLIVLDEATVYNASHLMGFFSVFNNDAIKGLTLYKGDIPASYDGRLSSLLEVNMKEGNSKQFSGSGGIGTISSRITLEGPIVTDRTSYMISARRTYGDLFLKLSSDPDINSNQLYFYDLNFKINHRINDNNRIFVSAYSGQDVFKRDGAGFSFGNQTITTRWNHLFSPRLFSNLSIIYSDYHYTLESKSEADNFAWMYKMRDLGMKYDFSYFITPENTMKFGYNITQHRLFPGEITSSGNNSLQYTLPQNNALEQAIYASNEQKVSDRLSLKYGLRLTAFSNMGAATIYKYDNTYNTVDSTVYGKNDIFSTFWRLSPRFGAMYQLNDVSSIKTSYSRTNQFMQVASNSAAGTPLDLWFTSGPNIKPQTCDQYALGYFHNWFDNEIETSVEVFYKDMQNTIDFRDHAQLLLNRKLDGELRFGKSHAYGAEFLIQKQQGRFNGWISYAYSRTFRQINGVNNNKEYVPTYDKPHTISIVANYELTPKVTLSASFVFATGQPFTTPVARGAADTTGISIPIYSTRNGNRIIDYHRMDVAVNWKVHGKGTVPWAGELNFSVYNVYGRKNPWSINFVNDEDKPGQTKAEMTYLFTYIPSITYNFKF